MKGVLFDLDGTLIDTAPAILTSFHAAFAAVKRMPPPDPSLRATIGRSLNQVLDEFAPGLGRAEEEVAIAAFRKTYDGPAADQFAVYDGVPDALEALRTQGFLLFVVTSKPAIFASGLIERAGLSDRFDAVLGTGLDERGWRSGKRKMVGKVVRRASLDPAESWLVGDQPTDIGYGRAENLNTAAVLCGYGGYSDLLAAGPDMVVQNVGEFARRLGSAAAPVAETLDRSAARVAVA